MIMSVAVMKQESRGDRVPWPFAHCKVCKHRRRYLHRSGWCGCKGVVVGDGSWAAFLSVVGDGLGWEQCYWCWRWEWNMYIPYGVNQPLCNRCLDLDEPPWYPNDRQRFENETWRLFHCQLKLPRTGRGLGKEATTLIASFLSSDVVP